MNQLQHFVSVGPDLAENQNMEPPSDRPIRPDDSNHPGSLLPCEACQPENRCLASQLSLKAFRSMTVVGRIQTSRSVSCGIRPLSLTAPRRVPNEIKTFSLILASVAHSYRLLNKFLLDSKFIIYFKEMLFFTCASGVYKELIPLYEFCVKRAYPDASVKVLETNGPSRDRFLINPLHDYVHITDIDILILPHEVSHQEYYGQKMFKGAAYLRGATIANGQEWFNRQSRICGGHISFTQEFYEKTQEAREFYSHPENCDNYREFDEVMLQRILSSNGYPIPKEAYTFISGEPWDKEFRDIHINDFWGVKWKKWAPERSKVKDLITTDGFADCCKGLSPRWSSLINKIVQYAT